MADDMCGPSNGLQNFQKHTTVDRTLQQDRLIHRTSPSQGFRSSPGGNARLADHEFEAFQAGQLPPDAQPFNPQPFSHGFSHAHPPPQQHQPGPSAGWASDFQRMNISSPSPQIHQPFTPQRQAAGGWHQEFARQQNQMQPPSQQPSSFQPSQYSPMNRMDMNYQPQSFSPQLMSSIAQQKQPETTEDAAFARAFEEAARHEEALMQEREDTEMREEQGQGQGVELGHELGQDILINESASRLLSSDSEKLAQQARIGADQIHDPASMQQEQRPENTDPDALARTAGQLLHSVRNDQSSKFQNSQFLNLMRMVRDREVMVEGDKFVGTNDREGDAERAIEVAKAYPSPPPEFHPSHG
ncbi:hypothetical protein LSUE1_G004412 [Lachnellula suecica]|uniref:Peroxin 20 n=1 Tax=Lachnellula suecica TaxID=602035 RepID=A0A8T9CAL4_9HELO|nr:hypothetical protein LSUE1_G004412 [Lachnellula suecica]